MASTKPTQNGLDRRKLVGINPETVTNITSTDFPGHHAGEDNSWSLPKFKDNLKVQFHQNEADEATFSLIGVDAAIANAFRRILIAEVPTLAIEKVYVQNNTSVIADEVLAHRLGLIPLKGNIEGLKWLKWFIDSNPEFGFEGTGRADYNTVVLHLHVRCERNPHADKNATEPEEKYINSTVYSRHIQWEPQGQQQERFKDGPIEPVSPDILIAKLRPGQEIDMVLHAHLGIGADHAKFSPVATATYRLMPTITITKPILGADARKFQKCFPPGVIDLDRVTPSDAASDNPAYHGREGDEKAVVKDPMRDTVSRECLRHDEFKDKVKLGRVQDHFIFNVESTGQFPSDMLFLESVNVLKYKAKRLLRALDEMEK
ncbi:DNA-directed RNA polymerase core subunit rpc40 [Exophiala dermatitidis]|uniref:DNA-directed RNA polymerases I and III subunit RPAC1 n=2 Tax=Exophiala dermatitidis TaxID=5970 RepID=H6BPX3_EXODN|nr:DNA-directed RNA Polymerase III subunit C5 [Exophiala dermatitidis NIH/UT8656]KAJ4518805.1 DNA-directed RNA polymerase core subunit rpc40 [Exophiala dermatitidis]EHY53696.1 DNA-directed RNA Polymerase III subunit C5 [Exophiala dermatitidis NIH/UT8656]KAJ4522126.1 DNA-directed RNA polymerase core subunit rpc40 [Exophiala dermatitidis]KAJ4529452.1 DNA-directed RNA polymerase core subunit rpc40 [Exophiala dermatitidis]KAJ4543893.1 DNA-directed RNA polymerase core subunit rpc40 [Exophiala derma